MSILNLWRKIVDVHNLRKQSSVCPLLTETEFLSFLSMGNKVVD